MKSLQNPSKAKSTPPPTSMNPEPPKIVQATQTIEQIVSSPQSPTKPEIPAGTLPTAPDPSTELNQQKSSVYSVCDADREAIGKIPVADLDSADDAQPEEVEQSGLVQALKPDGLPMTEAEFAEFWGIGCWDTVAQAGDLPMVNRDLSPVVVAPEKHDQARKAATAMYRLTDKYPKALGWMKSPVAAATGEMGACVMFFGSQLMILATCLKAPPRSAAAKEVPHE